MKVGNCRACGTPCPPNPIGRPRVLCGAPDCRRADERDNYRRVRVNLDVWAAALDLTDAGPALRERFWSKVAIGQPDECWLWTANAHKRGYGAFVLRKYHPFPASRVAYALAVGPLADGEVACHHCDNPPCCNPGHLFKGTQSDNGMDCVEKGRKNSAKGEAHANARLDEAAVARIRATPMTFGVKAALAREYGVSHTAIRCVLSGKTWRHVA